MMLTMLSRKDGQQYLQGIFLENFNTHIGTDNKSQKGVIGWHEDSMH